MSMPQAPAAATIEFFTHKWCPFAHRVWLCLEELQIPHQLIEIDLYGGKPQWFLDLNPRGLVPVIRDGDTCELTGCARSFRLHLDNCDVMGVCRHVQQGSLRV